ncbi:hypothetical protein Rhopal_001797-T1 [Rhodotorula paludigena]|uniref:Protein CPL1-like domain-containing protein n=1 Tax=Rhodotorula paludigena TaxID=86838 RepID=A0AAV5GGX7_9BASI|nr:hypothetical protein Rhopal_001797-T1 [Rhodotorula paludigena]
MLRIATLLAAAALLSADAVRASAVSHSVFPNSACAGASSSLSGLVGIGKITLSNGEVESHCGCISDNLAEFELCPSSGAGQAVCNSSLDLHSNVFTAACGVETCAGDDCATTVVNKVVVDEDECFNSEKGATGIVTVNGEAKCGCASDDADAFSPCHAPANGRSLCVATDSDFLGSSAEDSTSVACQVVCDDGFFLTPGGQCTKLAKRDFASSTGPIKVGPSPTTKPHHGGHHTPGHHGGHHTPGHHGSKTHEPHGTTPTSRHPHQAHTTPSHGGEETPSHSREPWASYTSNYPHGPGKVGPSPSSMPHGSKTKSPYHPTSHHPHAAHPTSGATTTTSYSYKHHHHHPSSVPHGGSETSHTMGPSQRVSSARHHGHHTTGPIKVGPHPTTTPGTGPSHDTTPGTGPSHTSPGVGPSQRARRAAEEFVFSDACAQDERTCPAGSYGDFSCVRLDDVTECGGCHSTSDARNCLEIEGASSVSCLRGGCVVRSCQTGYVQTSEGTCERKA